jgi:hypothetical protein
MEGHFAMRIKSIALAGVVLAATSPAALADFSHTTCTSPKFMAYMSAHIGRGKFINGGRQNPRGVLYGPIIGASLVSNDGKTIICEVTLSRGGRPGTRTIHGRFTATGHSWHFLPAY